MPNKKLLIIETNLLQIRYAMRSLARDSCGVLQWPLRTTHECVIVKQIFRTVARKEKATESVLKTPNSHAAMGLAYNGTPRRSVIRVDSGSFRQSSNFDDQKT
jgi:hypothetical protein